MTDATVESLWRHPIKSHGREALDRVALERGQGLPGDRAWAVAHQNSDADGRTWAPCRNFTRAAVLPALMAIEAETLDDGRLRLSHPERAPLDFDPATEAETFLDWVSGLEGDSPFKPARLVRAETRAMTDSDFPSVTLCSRASHRAVEAAAGRDLSIHRWRGNVWLDGLEPWAEFDWIGRELRLGGATLVVRERTGRCKATHTDPATGVRDLDTTGLLQAWGHADFSVRAEVVAPGPVAIGDRLELL